MEKVDSEIDDVSLRLALACLQLPHMVDVSPAGVPISTANDATDGGDELEDTTECTQSDAAYNKEEKGDTNQSVGLLQPPACLPTITMLVCADIDLQSASELAEYTLRQQQHRNNSGSMNYRTPFDAHAIDLIVVAGPCTRGEGDLHYYSSDGGGGGGGSNGGRRSHSLSGSGNDRTGNFNHDNDNNIRNTISSTRSNSHRQWKAARRRERLSASTALTAQTDKQSKSFSASQDEQDTTELDDDDDNYDDDGLSPFFRTKEESIGLQGILTAAISQLESIVCRVVYCPGWQDPLTILQQHQPHPPHNGPPPFAAPRSLAKRLTPNSRNIHQQWLPLAPGLGCAGLFYLDGIDKLVGNDAATTTTPPTTTDNSGVYADKAPKDDDSEEQNDEFMLMDQIKKLQQWYAISVMLSEFVVVFSTVNISLTICVLGWSVSRRSSPIDIQPYKL